MAYPLSVQRKSVTLVLEIPNFRDEAELISNQITAKSIESPGCSFEGLQGEKYTGSIRVLYHKIGIDVGAELRAIEYSDVPPTASSDDPNFLAYARHEISISTVKSNGQTNILRRQKAEERCITKNANCLIVSLVLTKAETKKMWKGNDRARISVTVTLNASKENPEPGADSSEESAESSDTSQEETAPPPVVEL